MAINLRDLVARLRVVFDKQSADQAEGQARRTLGNIKGTAIAVAGGIAAAFAAAFTVRNILEFGKQSVRAAMDADAVWNRLSGTLRTVGVDFQNVERDIKAAARAMQDTTTVGDEDFAAILTDLVSISRDYQGSLRNVSIVADLAAAKQIDLRTAAQLVGRAMIGETGTLKRYGIAVQEGADAVEAMRQRFSGMAANEAKTFAGAMAQLSNEWGDFKEAVGGALIEAGNGESVLQTLIAAVKAMTQFVEENRGAFAFWGRLVIETLQAVARTMWAPIRIAHNLLSAVSNFIVGFLSSIHAAVLSTFNAVIKGANLLIEGLNRLPGVNINFRINEFDANRWWVEAEQRLRAIGQDAVDVGDALADLGRSWMDVARAATSAAHAQERATAAAPGGGDGVGAGAGGRATSFGGRNVAAGLAPISAPSLTPTQAANVHPFWQFGVTEQQRIQREADSLANTWLETHNAIANGAFEAAGSMVSAWEDAFDQLFKDGEDLGAFFATLGQGIAASLLAGVAAYANTKVQENVAAAIEAVARGFGALAMGDPRAGLYFKSAAEHGVAAAAWSALAGGAASAGNAVRGGGGGGSVASASARDVGGSQVRNTERPGAEVHIYLDPLSPNDPRFQRVVAGAERNARERYGPNAKVQYHRRSGG